MENTYKGLQLFQQQAAQRVFILHFLLHSVFIKSDLFQNNHDFKGCMTETRQITDGKLKKTNVPLYRTWFFHICPVPPTLFQVLKDGGKYFLDTPNEDCGNWMMFVRLARNQEEQTLVAYQHCGEVYFTTVKVVKPSLLHLPSKRKFIDKGSEGLTLLQ